MFKTLVQALATLAVLTSSAHAAVTMRMTSTSIVVSGVTPGGNVVLFGRSWNNVRGTVRGKRHSIVQRDDDADGVVTLAMEIPRNGVFVAVDYESGQTAASTSDGSMPRIIKLPPSHQWKDGTQTVDLNRGYVDFLLVRPGKGAWVLGIFQGTSSDADGIADGTLRLRLAAMQPLIGKDSPPPHATKKDVLVAIDPKDLDAVIMAAE